MQNINDIVFSGKLLCRIDFQFTKYNQDSNNANLLSSPQKLLLKIIHLRPIWNLQLNPFKNESNLKKNSSANLSTIVSLYFAYFDLKLKRNKRIDFFPKNPWNFPAIICKLLFSKSFFSEFVQPFQFLHYVLILCYSSEQSYCIR